MFLYEENKSFSSSRRLSQSLENEALLNIKSQLEGMKLSKIFRIYLFAAGILFSFTSLFLFYRVVMNLGNQITETNFGNDILSYIIAFGGAILIMLMGVGGIYLAFGYNNRISSNNYIKDYYNLLLKNGVLTLATIEKLHRTDLQSEIIYTFNDVRGYEHHHRYTTKTSNSLHPENKINILYFKDVSIVL